MGGLQLLCHVKSDACKDMERSRTKKKVEIHACHTRNFFSCARGQNVSRLLSCLRVC